MLPPRAQRDGDKMTQQHQQIEDLSDFEELDETVYPDGYPDGYEDPLYEVTGCDGGDAE